jgi:2-oxoglutarate dehydrogenase E2 component (dihydrolipoamide succinyltransferase)
MSSFEIKMPKLGESIEEGTITKWFIKVGDMVEEDMVLAEIATDKVDSEIPSPVEGKIIKLLFEEDAVVPVGETIAIVSLDGSDEVVQIENKNEKEEVISESATKVKESSIVSDYSQSKRFYSPLVKTIASKENISIDELESITGTGNDGRVKKDDLLQYIADKKQGNISTPTQKGINTTETYKLSSIEIESPKVSISDGDKVVEMDRVRKKIAEHMVMSKRVSPHVTSMVEADVTEMVNWRNKVKANFEKREGEKITFMPVIVEAVAKALKEFPQVNASTDGSNIILRKRVNVGMAVALDSGNLIVPVVKDADQKNLLGITKELNQLVNNARNNKLSPDDIQGGTFSISNFGSFRNVMGTPIINQPQVAILAVGTVEKKPAVLETAQGDVIAIRQKMFLSLSYDHRVVDGALGGAFLRRLADILEDFDKNREI